MLRKLFLIFVLICVTKCKRYPRYSVNNLYTILDRTSEYIKNLNNAYESSNTDTSNIDSKIAKYMETTTKMILQRQTRAFPHLQPIEEVSVLQGFKEALSINLPDFQDIALFSIQNGQQLLWLAAAIDSSRILLYQLFDNNIEYPKTALLLATYPQPNGKRIIVNNYGIDTLTVVQTNTDEIVVLRLGINKSNTYEFQFKQEFEIPGVLHMNVWFGMNQLYLGIASDAKVFLYTWLGEHFDQIDTLHFGARKLLFFRQKSFMHVILMGSLTRIFQFSVRSNKFIETQKLHGTRDASLFYFKEGRFEERFLALADDNSTIFYKEMYNRFVPFQKVAPARYVYSLTMGNTVILFAVIEENSATIYQYNGWRFIELRTRLSSIRRIFQIRSYGEDMLIVQNQDGEWKFLRPIWSMKKTWKTLRGEIETWCSAVKRKASQRSLEKILDFKRSVTMRDAYIHRLRVQNINDHNATELIRLTEQYRKTISKLNLANKTLAERTSGEKFNHTIVYGKKVTVQCKTNCYVHHLNTDSEIGPTYNSKRPNTINRSLKFANLKVKAINNWRCPIPNFVVKDIFVKESINGISMKKLQEETLKISGDQEVSGEHYFNNLNATSISIPLDIATHDTSARLQITEARVKEFHLVKNEFFLPLNGPTVTMTGSITAAKVRIAGIIEIRGTITGKSGKKLMPLTDIYTPLKVPYDCFLQNATFRNFVEAKDIVSPRKTSLKRILEDNIPLDSDVPIHLMLSSDKIQWDNVTLLDYKNWVTKNSTDTIIISGTKYASNDIVLTNVTYENLPTSKLTVPVCAMQVITRDIISSSITVDDLIVKDLHVSNVTGARDLNDTMFNSVSALQSVDFSTKLFTGRVVVKNISALEIKGVDVRALNSQLNKWIDVNHIKGPVNVSKLLVENLQTPVNLGIFLPTTVNTVIMLGNSNIGKINDVNMSSFIENVQKVHDEISLEHATFAHGFTSNHTHAFRSTLNLPHIDVHLNLHSKRISDTLETSMMNVPQTFGYVTSNASSTFIIEGTARFTKEPTVRSINDIDLEKLSEDLWMSDRSAVISGSNMNLRNMSIKEKVIVYNVANSLNINMWLGLSSKLLSKTKQQNITVAASFKDVVVPAVTAANDSTLQTSDPDLKNLLTNSLMRNSTKAQVVDATWHFDELSIGHLYWNGKFNDIDLNTDIVRFDAKQNIITGKKKVAHLVTDELWSHNNEFSKFAKYALTKKCRDITVIKGQKTFKNISLNNLSVNGKLAGYSIEQALLKSKNQTVFGLKKIHGHLNVSSLITESAVNDVILTQLIDNQVKKHELAQTIESEINFQKHLEVFGNITIGELYEGIDLDNISDNRLDAVLSRTTEVLEMADDIKTGLHNPAIYVSKFEEVKEDTLKITTNLNTEDVMTLNSTCVCEGKNFSTFCNNTKLTNILAGKNSSTFITTKLMLLGDTLFVVIVSSDFVSVYTYDDAEQDLHKRAELHVPDVLQASVEPTNHAIWIAVQLPRQTLVLRYQEWDEFEQYILPASDILLTSKAPNNQHLLIRSDGVWNLGGVFHPEHIFKLPLNGEVKTFALGTDYYVKVTEKNSTTLLKARYVSN
ncbi:uncharacterized protein LOC105189727 [Harpegnathos saltator]|uniref:uncharacterized protein LOC105189727 n=1 Tax=Harpegnathos saltator TaxID=610380 RepID=UPI000948CDF8|nr:uncharacterized protein LOC105189727 [Harpegnathos saltator]